MKISICIPTFNRAKHLTNCLHSIVSNELRSKIDFQVCVSDNCSTDETEDIVQAAQQHIKIKYHKNDANLGVARNVLNVVSMADGEFVWLIGDDDLLLPDALRRLCALIDAHPSVEYFYVNALHLTTEFVHSFPQPFDTSLLPVGMEPFSARKESGEMRFMDLIDPKVSFDFLGGMFLAVFRRQRWNENIHMVDSKALSDDRVFSHFDNTFVHVKVFANAFTKSKAYFCSKPFSVCLAGAREWSPMYSLITAVRLIEALEEYRKNGLPFVQYIKCRNFSLRNFIPDLAYMYVNKDVSGYVYIRPLKLILNNSFYPNTYLSLLYYLSRKIKSFFCR